MQLLRSAKGKIHVVDDWPRQPTDRYTMTICGKWIVDEKGITENEPTCKICLQILKLNRLDAASS